MIFKFAIQPRESIHQEDVTIRMHQIAEFQNIKLIFDRIKVNKYIIILEEFNTVCSVVVETGRKWSIKSLEDLMNKIYKTDYIYIFRIWAKNRWMNILLKSTWIFTKIDDVLGIKTILKLFKVHSLATVELSLKSIIQWKTSKYLEIFQYTSINQRRNHNENLKIFYS